MRSDTDARFPQGRCAFYFSLLEIQYRTSDYRRAEHRIPRREIGRVLTYVRVQIPDGRSTDSRPFGVRIPDAGVQTPVSGEYTVPWKTAPIRSDIHRGTDSR